MSDPKKPENKNAPATTAAPKPKVKELLNRADFQAQLRAALPKHITPDRMVRVVLTAGMRNPRIFDCTQESLFLAVLNCAAAGLEPDGRKAHLIPYQNRQKQIWECQLILGYSGLIELAMRSGQVSNIHPDVVCEMDDFEVNGGQLVRHSINYRVRRGEPYAAYCIVRFKDKSHIIEVMSKFEIEAIRDDSPGWKAFKANAVKTSPWDDQPFEMWKKTVVRRVIKWLPQSAELSRALSAEADQAIDVSGVEIPALALAEGLEGAIATEAPPAPQAGQGAQAAGAPAPAEPTPEEKARADDARGRLRKKIIEELQEAIFAGKATEKGLLARAKELKLPPWDKDPAFAPADPWELPTDTLAVLVSPKV